jgi:hypothetical protein
MAQNVSQVTSPHEQFGHLAWKWLKADSVMSEDAWELWGLAVAAGLAERVPYDPERHNVEDAEPGDEVTVPREGF